MVAAAGRPAVTLHSVRERTLLVIPIRIVLGVALFGAARVAGARNGPALFAFAIGLLGVVFVIFNDPRARFVHGPVEPLPFPGDATVAAPWRQALGASIPSTIGVAALTLIALAPQPTLAALLAGVEAGLGVAALISLGRVDPSLYIEPKSRAVYRR